MKNFVLLGLVIVAVTMARIQGASAGITAASTAKSQVMDTLLGSTQAAADIAKQCIEELKEEKMSMINEAKECVSNYKSLLGEVKAAMLDAGMTFKASAMDSAIDKINGASSAMSDALGSMSSLISSFKTSLGNAKSTILSTILDGASSFSFGFVDKMTSALGGASSFGMNLVSFIPFFG